MSADELARAVHREYIVRVSGDSESFEFQVSEHLRLSGVYWGACALHLLDSLHTLDAAYVVSFVRSCQHGCGGFGGNLGHDAHILYTLSAVQVLALFDALHVIDADHVMRWAPGRA
jgi:geranylgeranyl transferase type-2 subunit beta